MSLNELGAAPEAPAAALLPTADPALQPATATSFSPSEIRQAISRDAILGYQSSWQISNLGAVQFRHGYDPQLLTTILERALELKDRLCANKHLNLTYIRGAQRYIPEIEELIRERSRLSRLGCLAGTALEPYPISVISSTITFMGPEDGDGAIDWHCDGVPVTELIPLQVDDHLVGGELDVFLGNPDIGRSLVEQGTALSPAQLMKVRHKVGYSTLAQLIGILHRTAPIERGTRVTLNLNLRSVERPFVDDNRLFYLAADNDEDSGWLEEVTRDMRERQLPAYRRYEAARMAQGGGKASPSA